MSGIPLTANWNYPTAIRMGPGRINELALACRSLGMQTPLLVTDPDLAPMAFIKQALEICARDGLNAQVFKDIKSNPTEAHITQGVDAYRAGHHDGVIAMGGGSALDAGKAIALMVGQSRPIWDFEDIGDYWTRVNVAGMAPVVALPTTAGTGSELGRSSVITDEIQHIKKIIFHPKMLPPLVILDPELTLGLPPHLTAATGMDALSHNLEAYCATYFHPMAEGIALEGMRLIKHYLPRAVHDGQDLEARSQMLVASGMGATAFQRGLGAMHALAHPLGAVYGAHHGRLNAILMPYVLLANRPAIEQKIIRLTHYLGIPNGFDGFMQWIIDLRKDIGIEHTLKEIGIDNQHLAQLAMMATQDAAAGSNPIPFSANQYQLILSQAIHGDKEYCS